MASFAAHVVLSRGRAPGCVANAQPRRLLDSTDATSGAFAPSEVGSCDCSAATALERLSTFTRLVAAVTRAVDALGVHWAEAPVTHAPEAQEQPGRHQGATIAPRLPGWVA